MSFPLGTSILHGNVGQFLIHLINNIRQDSRLNYGISLTSTYALTQLENV